MPARCAGGSAALFVAVDEVVDEPVLPLPAPLDDELLVDELLAEDEVAGLVVLVLVAPHPAAASTTARTTTLCFILALFRKRGFWG